jgi:hypothetical protein
MTGGIALAAVCYPHTPEYLQAQLTTSNKEPRPICKNHFYITWMEEPKTKTPGKGRMVIPMY